VGDLTQGRARRASDGAQRVSKGPEGSPETALNSPVIYADTSAKGEPTASQLSSLAIVRLWELGHEEPSATVEANLMR